jgi:hypothetical protein
VTLKACLDCRQLFVSVFCESVDFVNGNDPQGFLVVPISADEAQTLRGLDESATERAVLALTPKRRCLDAYWPSSGPKDIAFCEGPTLLAPHD